MRIMFICDTMGSGGAERVIATLSNGFVEKGHNVSILMLSNEATDSFYKLNRQITLFNLLEEKTRFFNKAKQIRRVVIENKPDIVISFLSYVCIYTWLALKSTNIPYVVSERNDPNQRGRIKQFLLNKSFRKAAGCVFQTEDALNWYNKIVRTKTIIIHNPVSLDFSPVDISHKKNQILYVGRLNEQKNCSMLIDAFGIFSKKYPDYSLKMYGSGHLLDSLLSQIKDKNLEDKIQILSSSKEWQKDECGSAVFALPSRYEGMPNVLAEALSLGIPSVSTNCTIGGPKELKKFFPDLLVLSKSRSASDFALAIEDALKIQHQKAYIPQELSKQYIVDKWLSFIDKILNR